MNSQVNTQVQPAITTPFTVPASVQRMKDSGELWGVGMVTLPQGIVPYYLSCDDVLADAAWVEKLFQLWGVKAGHVGYVSYMLDQMGQCWPLFLACVSQGIPLVTGLNSRFDAGRKEMFLRCFNVEFVFGISGELLSGLGDVGHNLVEVLSRTRLRVALPDAWDMLEEHGIAYWKLQPVGPVLAIEPPEGGGFIYDDIEWKLTETNGQIFVSSSPWRACGFEQIATGLYGSLVAVDGQSRLLLNGTK